MLRLEQLTKRFPLASGFFAPVGEFVEAVKGVSLTIPRGSIYGLVGESGSGKTTLARMIVRLVEPTAGRIVYTPPQGPEWEITTLDSEGLRRWRALARYVFQDPARSLNPRQTIRDILVQSALYCGRGWKRDELSARAEALMERVGLKRRDLERRPADFSGGQRQRISIARALMSQPELLLCDEVVSALDVSFQAQILRLLLQLRQELGLTILFIAHDLAVVHYISDRVGVMYRGELVEEGDAREVLNQPHHPYTRSLLEAVPDPGPRP